MTTSSPSTTENPARTRSPRVVVLDYGSGNLRSAERALQRVGADVEVTADHRAALAADGLVVPGVGAFAACAAGLRSVSGERLIEQRLAGGRPVLGICVGMQVLFDRGVEFGEEARGAGQWPGTVEKLQADVLPHMGWNTVSAPQDSVLFAGMDPATRFYFVHSFAVRPLGAGGARALPAGAGHVGAPRRGLRRRRRERAAVGHPVPPREVGRRGRGAADQLARRAPPVILPTISPDDRVEEPRGRSTRG